MKIVITGSLGHIGKPLTQELIEKGNDVTVISSKQEKQKDIEAIGATAAIGSVDDVEFLTETFKGADAAFIMIPPNFKVPDQVKYYEDITSNYVKAIRQSGIKRVVALSSYGAHLEKGTGFIVGSHRMEKMLNDLSDVSVTHVRPGYFYYNLLGLVGMIKAAGFMGANYGDEDKLVMVAPADIAAAVADEITKPKADKNVIYVASDDRSCNEIAAVLGKAIGKPDLKWMTLSSEQMKDGLQKNGVPANAVENLVELGEAIHKGILRENFDINKPEMGKIKIEEYANEFAKAYNQ